MAMMSGALGVVMIAMMAVMMGGMVVGGAWAVLRRNHRSSGVEVGGEE